MKIRALWSTLALVALILAGCAWGEQPDWSSEGDSLRLSSFWEGEVSSEFVYYFAFDPDGDPLTGPESDPADWESGDYYIVRWERSNFYLRKPGEGEFTFYDGEVDGDEIWLELSLEEMGNPEVVDIMVVSTDLGGNFKDSLDRYFSVYADQDFVSRDDPLSDVEEPSANLERVEVEIQ